MATTDARPGRRRSAPSRLGHLPLRRWAGLGAAFVALTLVMYLPTASSLRRSLPWNLGDPALNTWISAWEHHALFHAPTEFFAGNMFFPYGDALNYSELMLAILPVFGLVYGLSGNAVLAHNIALLALAVGCLAATFGLAKRLLGSDDAAAFAAIAFSFSGFVFMHLGHAQLLTLGFIPLGFHVLFWTRERPSPRRGALLGLVTFGVVTACFYFGAIWAVCLGTVAVVDLARTRLRPPRRWWSAMGVAAAVSAVLLAPVAHSYVTFQRRTGFKRDLMPELGLKAADLLTPAPGSRLYSGLADSMSAGRGDVVEHGFFPGFVPAAFALAGVALLVRSLRRRRAHAGDAPGPHRLGEVGLVALCGAASCVIAIGPSAFGVAMPYRLLYELVPGFDGMKAVSRLAVPGMLALAILAGFGFGRLVERLAGHARAVVTLAVAALTLAELSVAPKRAWVDTSAESAAVYEALHARGEGAVVELPLGGIGPGPALPFVEGPRLLASIGDWRPRFNGFSGDFPEDYFTDAAVISTFPSPEALERLQALGIRFVVLHGGPGELGFEAADLESILARLPSGVVVDRYGPDVLIDTTPHS